MPVVSYQPTEVVVTSTNFEPTSEEDGCVERVSSTTELADRQERRE